MPGTSPGITSGTVAGKQGGGDYAPPHSRSFASSITAGRNPKRS